jgi:hypothetical protein
VVVVVVVAAAVAGLVVKYKGGGLVLVDLKKKLLGGSRKWNDDFFLRTRMVWAWGLKRHAPSALIHIASWRPVLFYTYIITGFFGI